MVTSVGARIKPRWCVWKVATHSGIFHPDDVTGVAEYGLAHMDSAIDIVRTEDEDELNQVNDAIDIGGGRFDHHMKGFNECRVTGEKYASAGLVWRELGEQAIYNVAKDTKQYITEESVQIIKEQIDKEVMIPIDLEDNGISAPKHMFSAIVDRILPSWVEEQDADTFNVAFIKAERIIYDILKGIIRDKIVKISTEKFWQNFRVKERSVGPVLSSIQNGILELPAQTIEWKEEVINYNKENGNIIKFVIFPYPRGGWAAQCVPPSMEEEFKQLVPFPEEWAGENKKTLPEISGVTEAILCHKDRFFARAQSKAAIIQMCKIAMVA